MATVRAFVPRPSATPAHGDRDVPFAPPLVGAEEIAEVVATLESGWLSTGPRVAAFEERFAGYVGAPHAVALNSCTAALHLSLLAAGIGAGDEVITTPLTFCATANAIIHTGATPVFADVDLFTGNLDPRSAAAAVTSRTRAVLPVHYAGRPADMARFEALARRHGLALIEDAAHCVEGRSGGRKVGAIGDFTCFSFYATKNLTTGEGGMVTTSDARAAAFMRSASLHGMSRNAWTRYAPGGAAQYEVTMAGFKYNMMDLQAAIGLHQLARIDQSLARREAIWRAYDEALANLPIRRPGVAPEGDVHARHLYQVLIDPAYAGVTRDELHARLRERGVSTSIHFRALHLQPFYQERFGLSRGLFPIAESISDRTLSLPLSAAMPDADVHRVIEAVHDALR
ncbi:MAG TPA: DegT/DnrJ/EryC1/StrS family aminotransferase [Vicinamibacterales bacterium]|nr:DegT/DnrJ/EryC1/StrS family aminotransferase [Vicinamibacterales bacterium]